MTTSSLRLGLTLPDDGGAGGDDTVDVTAQISNNFSALDGAVGLFECTAITRPVSGNYNGRLIIETDTGKILRYSGGGWKYVCHDPMTQYGNGFDQDTAALVATVTGNFIAFRSGTMIYSRILNIAFNSTSALNVARTITTTSVGFRPQFQTATSLAVNNNTVAQAIWETTGVISIIPYSTVPAGAFFHGFLSAPTAGYV